MLCIMAFHLCGKVAALYHDNNSSKAYICNQGGTESLFIPDLACHIFNLANKHNIFLIVAYIPTHLNVEDSYLLWRRLVPQ